MIDFKALHEYLRGQFRLGWHGIHGLPHWSRVWVNAKKVAQAERDRDSSIYISDEVLKLFSFLHDHQRMDDGSDMLHGMRAGITAKALRGTFFDISDEEMDMLVYAMEYHSSGMTIAIHPTIMVCWDADRLDLGRVGKRPDPKYLCTVSARDNAMIVEATIRSMS